MYDSYNDDFYLNTVLYYKNKEIEDIDIHINNLKNIKNKLDEIYNNLQEHINLFNKNLDDCIITQKERNKQIKARYIKNKANIASNHS